MKRIIIALSLALCIMLVVGCQQVSSSQVKEVERTKTEFNYVCDFRYKGREPFIFDRIFQYQEEQAALKAQQELEQQMQEEVYYYEEYYEPYYGDNDYSNSANGDGFMQAGVRDGVDGTTETWYSSNSLYHYRTGEWTADENGYYRDSDGYYVVASEDHAEGEVIETSVGQAKVYDSGCESGVVDFYVNF